MKGDRVLIAGIGNEEHGDDAAGVLVLELAGPACGASAKLRKSGEPLELLDSFDEVDLAVIVDATHSDALPGTLIEVDLSSRELGVPSTTSTHGIDLLGALAIARALGQAPRRVVLLGIEGVTFRLGDPVSPPVRRALPLAAARVIQLATGVA